MIVCHAHWDRLRQLVCERGMGHLLHQPHGDFEDLTAELCGRKPWINPFDPLDTARDVAQDLAVSHSGRYLLAPAPDGHERCPICELVRCECGEPAPPETYWSERVVDVVLARARQRGLLPRPA